MRVRLLHRLQGCGRGNALVTGVVIGAVALTITACRGTTPEQEEQQRQRTSEVSQTPGAISVEWTDTDLETDASRIGYGSKPKEILARSRDGALVFTPETPRDHIATRFIELSAHDGGRSLELILDVQSPGGEACAASLQDQAFNMLVTAPCKTVGEHKATAMVSDTVNSVRLYFQSPQQARIQLPARVALVEHR